MPVVNNVEVKNASNSKKHFYLFLFGVLCTFSPIRGLMALQTSINIKDGIGSVSGTIFNMTSVFTSLFLTPTFIRRFGARKTMLFSELMYIFFILGNSVSSFYTMIPGSVFGGIGEGSIWPCISLYNVHYATKYSKYGSKTISEYIMDCTGLFFVTLAVTQVVGNLLSYCLLSVGSQSSHAESANETERLYDQLHNNITSHEELSNYHIWQHCGANDCQDPNITSHYYVQYAPENRMKVYILLIVFFVLGLFACLLHYSLLPNSHENVLNVDSLLSATEEERTVRDSTSPNTLLSTFRLAFSSKQLLITPIEFYAGTVVGFVISEISRAFVSCIIGVAKVGLALTAYGIVGLFAAYFSSKIAGKLGPRTVVFVCVSCDLTAYLFCLLWNPGKISPLLVFIPTMLFGFTGSSWQTLTNALCAVYFKKKIDLAFSLWGCYVVLGICFPFAWSTLVCVSTKLYTQICLCIVSLILFGVADFKYGKNTQPETSIENKNTQKELSS